MRIGTFVSAFVFFLTGAAQAVPIADTRTYSSVQLRSDLMQMYRSLQSADYDLYAFTSKAEMDREYAATLASLDKPMTKFEAEIRFEEFASHIHQGHARVDFPYAVWSRYRKNGGRAFPLSVRVVGRRIFVEKNMSGLAAIVPGDEIVSIDGGDAKAWLERCERHVSAETPYMAGTLMEYDFQIYMWVELGDVPGFRVALRKSDGHDVSLYVPARTQEEMKSFATAQPSVLSLETPPREAKMLDGRVAYLRPGPFYNSEARTGREEWDNSGFRAFIDGAFAKFLAAHANALIIDLRDNPGGDNLFSDTMIAWIADRPFRFFSQFKVRVSSESTAANADRITQDAAAAGPVSQQYAQMYAKAKNGDIVDFDLPLTPPRAGPRFTGKVYLLVNRKSYSNTVSVAALVQDYKFGTVLGEETSDMATTYGAMEQFTLFNSGIKVGYPKAHIVRPNGDMRSRGVIPDIAIGMPVVQPPSDPVLQRAIAIARGK
jgi:C-terminal processing protease CtpA/Prc